MSRSAQRSEHNRHDRLLIARFATNDSYREEEAQAADLVQTCRACAQLAEDVRAISRATALLPAPRRSRDFRLAPEQAAGVRGSWFDRFLRRLAGPGLPALRPIAGVALSIGLALAVVGTGFPLFQMATPAAAPEFGGAPAPASSPDRMSIDTGGATATPADREGQAPEATSDTGQSAGGGGRSSPGQADDTFSTTDDGPFAPEGRPVPTDAAQPPADLGRLLLVYGGVTLAAISFAVLLLAWYARRREDPLLR